jgi:hypothetical protein
MAMQRIAAAQLKQQPTVGQTVLPIVAAMKPVAVMAAAQMALRLAAKKCP